METTSTTPTERIELEIEGMTCGSCIRQVRSALVGLDGVEIEDMSLGSAEIAYDPTRTSREEIVEAIRDQGYAVE